MYAFAAIACHVVAVGGDQGPQSSANAINNRGVVAGQMNGAAYTWDGTHLVTFLPVAITPLDGPYSSTVTGINDAGVAVGHDGNYKADRAYFGPWAKIAGGTLDPRSQIRDMPTLRANV